MKQMGLFKRFTDKASKAELESFKSQLKYGTDPKAMYDSSQEHLKEYRRLDEEVKALLNKILKSPNCDTTSMWSEIDIQDYGRDIECDKSPVGKHVYMNTYGSKHPDRYKATDCLCCGKQLYRASKDPNA